MSNHATIAALKQNYIEKIGGEEDKTVEQLRMFYMGKELKDDLFLYSYDICENLTI
jgi:hypothetical protein